MPVAKSEQIFRSLEQKSVKISSYFAVYDAVLARYADKKDLVIAEIGVMNGGSLYLWRKMFPQARVIGIDLSPTAAAMREHGFEIFIGDQSDPAFWKDFFDRVGQIDVLLDDGAHTNKGQIMTVECCLDGIRDGGVILIEDTVTSYLRQWGNPSRYSFVNYAKGMVDKLTTRNALLADRAPTKHSSAVYSVSFYESMVCLHIDRRLCRRSEIMTAGTAEIGASNYWNADKRLVGFLAVNKIKAFVRSSAPPAVGRAVTACYARLNLVVQTIRFVAENRALRRFF